MSPFGILVVIALIATIAVLFVGVFSMARGGEFDRKHSVQLMFARVSIQAITVILIIVAAIYAGYIA